MSGIPEATPITLTGEERAELEGLARSTKTDTGCLSGRLRSQKIDLAGRKSWCESNDPEFAANAADVVGVGLYLAPPENKIVICVD